MRTDATELHNVALSALMEALAASGVDTRLLSNQQRPDLAVEGPGQRVVVEVTAVSVADPARVARLIEAHRKRQGSAVQEVCVLVADEITESTRQMLRDNGWGYLDRRGRLWFSAAGIRINDIEVSTSHLGMGWSREVMEVVAKELALPTLAPSGAEPAC